MAKRTHPFTVSATPGETGSSPTPAPAVLSAAAGLSVAALPRLIESFLLAGDINQHSARTLSSRRERLGRFAWWCGYAEVAHVTTNDVRRFLHYLTHGHEEEGGRWQTDDPSIPANFRPVSSGTVKAYHSTIRTFFNWLVEEEEIAASPLLKIPPPVDRPDQVQPFTQEQLAGLRNATKRPRSKHAKGGYTTHKRDEAIFLLLLDTGIRASELCALTVGDVDLAAGASGHIRIRHGKGGKARSVPFSRETKRALYRYLDERGETEPDAALFVAERGTSAGEPLTRVGLLKMIGRWGEAAGIERERVSPHTFRHTFAIEFLRAGGNVFTLKEILGHTSLAIVNRYVAIAQADITREHAQYSPVARMRKGGA